MDFSIAFVVLDQNTVRVDAAVGCGKRFEGIALIRDAFCFHPQTGKLNSKLELSKPLGFGAVSQIVQQWSQKAPEIELKEG